MASHIAEPQAHSCEREVDAELHQIANSVGMKYHSTLTRLSAYTYSYLPQNLFRLANRWHLMLWLIDDVVDNPLIPLIERQKLVIDLVCNTGVATKSLVQLFTQTMEEIKQEMITKPLLFSYFSSQVDNYLLLGILGKLALSEDCSLKDFGDVKEYDSACHTVWPLMLLDSSVDMDLTLYDNPNLLANRIVTHTNDYYSYDKDIHVEKTRLNYCIKYMEAGIIKNKEEIWDFIIADYNKLVAMKTGTHGVECLYLERLILWCEASFYWHRGSSRYQPIY